MIYGLNFGRGPLPEGMRKKFRGELKVVNTPQGYRRLKRGLRAILVGVCETADDLHDALMVAEVNTRRLHVAERSTAAGIWYGLYEYHTDNLED